ERRFSAWVRLNGYTILVARPNSKRRADFEHGSAQRPVMADGAGAARRYKRPEETHVPRGVGYPAPRPSPRPIPPICGVPHPRWAAAAQRIAHRWRGEPEIGGGT